MSVPLVATYRLQLRSGFGFADAERIVSYLQKLGVSHLYLSPIFKASAGSTHGYDIADPNVIEHELGGEEGFSSLVKALRDAGLGLLLDVVPNHLGVGPDNPYWQDLLASGADGEGAAIFDVDWQALAGGMPGKVLLPILDRPLADVIAAGDLSIEGSPPASVRFGDLRLPLAAGTAGGSIEKILAQQHWRLAWWRTGNELLNWRRFFDITDLAGVRVEDEAVFERLHQRVLAMLEAGQVQGLRLDHVDGLADPGAYLARLDAAWRERSPEKPWLLVEKILGPGEDLPESWPVAGTTGYEMLNVILKLFVEPAGLRKLDEVYRRFGGDPECFDALVARSKRDILERSLRAELDRLVMKMVRRSDMDLPPSSLRETLIRLICAFPYYRSYGDNHVELIESGLDQLADIDAFVIEGIRRGLAPGSDLLTAFEQLSGPAMAKAMEDTAFYRWHRLIALNEVGGEPHHPPMSLAQVHAFMAERASRWPEALIASATHDTKRGEDTRIRIAALSQTADEWVGEVSNWADAAERYRTDGDPEPDTIYFIFQTLVGVWPEVGPERDSLLERLITYFEKAMREAKLRTAWTEIDPDYEAAVADFLRGCLSDDRLVARIQSFCEKITPLARRLSLAQTLLKLTLPGIPDIYQGTEMIDQSLVDPDNRRPVDFDRLERFHEAEAKQTLIARTLEWRKRHPSVFTHGSYRPLATEGDGEEDFFAFVREDERAASVTIVGLRAQLSNPETQLHLPEGLADDTFISVMTGETYPNPLPVGKLLADQGIALLVRSPDDQTNSQASAT
ncbi:MAG: malto-oligosyltrehalose synthase [Geminicoccaceae bacterium]